MNLHSTIEYFKYCFLSAYWRGHRIHSPFVFNLVSEVINCQHPFYHFETIEQYRQQLLHTQQNIQCSDFGAGNHRNEQKKISNIAKRSAVQPKYGQLLSRLVHQSKPSTILELGSSLGIGSLYLNMAHPSARLVTLEGCPSCAEKARQALNKHNCNNSSVIVGNFDQTLAQTLETIDCIDFAWFDGNHRIEPTLRYFEQCLAKAGNHSVFVFDDIHWSKQMSLAWQTIVQHPRITISIDLYQIGIVFFRTECQKQNFRVRW